MKQVLYQMLPRLWGSGKFESVDAASLEYIRGLGVDYIWYTGLIRHATRKKDEGCRPSHPQTATPRGRRTRAAGRPIPRL